MRAHFHINNQISRPSVPRQIAWYKKHPEYIRKLSENARPYMYYVYHEVKKRGMPAEIALVPMIESGYDPYAYSHAGAAGLWQMMPTTAAGFGLHLNWWYDGRRDIYASTTAALDYLEYLHNFFHGDWLDALAAYDSGEGHVLSRIRYNAHHHRDTHFWALKLPRETRRYIPKLLALSQIIEHPRQYHVYLPPIPNKPYFSRITTPGQIDLNVAAKHAEIDINKIYELNPGL